jgi:AraC-like DNA-binding protein
MPEITETIFLKNMSCNCCIRLIKQELKNINVDVKDIQLGEITISYDEGKVEYSDIHHLLEENGFEIIRDREKQIVEQIKKAVMDLVHHSTFNSMVRNSDFLVEKFNMSYQHLSTLFSKHEKITLEKYIILHKIEKVKELIQAEDITLSEIAYMMAYSSVQYLSTQFKSVAGVSVSEFKKNPAKYRRPLELLTD